MSNSIIYNNFEFRWNRSDKTCFISIHNGGHHQGIISFESPFDYVTSQQYYLRRDHRLQITGVDVL